MSRKNSGRPKGSLKRGITKFKRTELVNKIYLEHIRIKKENSIIRIILSDIKERKQKLLIRLAIKEVKMTAKERKRIIRKLINLPQNAGKTDVQMYALAIEQRKKMTRKDNNIKRYVKMGLSAVEISRLLGESVSSIRRFIIGYLKQKVEQSR